MGAPHLPFGLALTLVALGCGARSELALTAPPDANEGGSAAGGAGPVDPDVDCPLPCTVESCLPVVLVEDTPIGWHAVADGVVYYTTAKPEGNNGLFRASACNGEAQLLLEADQFLGYGAVIGDEVFVTTAEPPETVRVPKSGGAPALYHSDVGAVENTLGIVVDATGELVLVRYHFDHSFALYQLDDDGELLPWVTNLPDPDWFALPSEGFGFMPNLPAIDVPQFDALWSASSLGIFDVHDPNNVPALSSVPVVGPLVAEVPDGGDWLYFTGESQPGTPQHYKMAPFFDPEVIPILGDSAGLILAVDDDVLFGASPHYAEHEGSVWRASADDSTVSEIFRSGQFVQDVVPGAQSLYVRTERRLVRVPKLCPEGSAAPCVEPD